jgi:radical SAM protein with 4Fe4S-binding SPASM domain
MDCVHFPELDWEEFVYKLRETRVPLSGGMEITHRCNVRCVHCYCRLAPNDEAARSHELGADEIRHIAVQLAEEGCLFLYITGGEPLLRPDFLDVYDSIRDQGILITLFTNGTLLTPEIADHLAQRPPFVVEISLYGATRNVYESITGVHGSYARCRQGIQLLMERGIKLRLKTPVLTLNKDEVDALQAFADDLGVPFRCNGELMPRFETLNDRFGPYRYALSPEEDARLSMRTDEMVEGWRAYLARLKDQPRPATLFNCGAGVHGFFIDPYGELMVCSSVRSPSYSLRTGTFKEGWEVFLRDIRFGWMAEADSICLTCDLYALCHQCPGRAQLEYGPGVAGHIVETHCRLAHVRKEVFQAAGILD